MSFLETVEKARAFLERNGRVSLRALQREFDLDDGALDELLDERLDLCLVEAELEPQGAERDAPVAFQERPGLLDCFQKAHLILEAQIRFYALGDAPGSVRFTGHLTCPGIFGPIET